MNDPGRHAASMREAYQTYLKGRGGIPARSVSHRLQPDSAGESTLAGMRGPYLQALPIANWSDTDWESFARAQSLHPNVIRAFKQEGFRRLYDFQERSIETILNGEDTVITAATGRGKTEAWLIPILDQIVTAKRDEDGDGRTPTKALLLYPTKALAQDQFKRLVQILYRINRNLRQKEWVTVGIYDGDTPRNINEPKSQGYLNRTFQHFGCPGANDELEKCQRCRQGVFVERSMDDFRLRPDKPRCETDENHKVPLDFVRLTKHSVLKSGADIILTNPDTLNYRLLNINAEKEQNAFVYDPSFLVFDEVHTYDGLLGSYTATLVKRLRRLRESNNCDPLQVIGSSATVKNDSELFRQISGSTDVSHVSENPRELSANSSGTVPKALRQEVISPDDILAAGQTDRKSPEQLGDIDLTVADSDSLDNERVEECIADLLYDFYTKDESTDSVVRTLQSLHAELTDSPRTIDAFIKDCADKFEITSTEAETLVDNFQQIGQLAGLLESRNHLFSWPLDGFYACASCTAAYRSPQDVCAACGSAFVTRATYCRQCNEEYLVANICSRCDRLEPYVHTDEGLIDEGDHDVCSTCIDTGKSAPMHQVTFRPYHECTNCGTYEGRSVVADCPNCDAPGVPTGDGEFTCRNPDCGRTWSVPESCSVCAGSEFELARIPSSAVCTGCGKSHEYDALPTTCTCGKNVRNNRLLPWVCDNENCDSVHFTREVPERCSCGSQNFAKGGLVDIAVTLSCTECGEEVVPGGNCRCNLPSHESNEGPYRRYRTWDENGCIVSPLDHRNAMPCSHGLYSTVVGDAFDELIRSPTNVAVTTSQYLLRDLVGESGLNDAKLLSFSDSHRDMKELDRAFTDPEVETALDQLVLTAISLEQKEIDPRSLSLDELHELRLGDISTDGGTNTDWARLDEVIDTAYALLLTVQSELAGDDVRAAAGIDLAEVILGTPHVEDQERAVKDRLHRQTVRYVGERQGAKGVSLEHDGLIDVRLMPDIDNKLESAERNIVASLSEIGNAALQENVTGGSESLEAAANRLLQRDILNRPDEDRLALSSRAVEITDIKTGEVQYNPWEDRYYTTLRHSFDQDDETVTTPDTLLTRAEDTHPRFSERAYTATRTRVTLLLSRLYYGSTPKIERREIEHRFRSEPSPNFLSSGPAMELGVDIGSLDALLMYGTPPNMNAYLQRVGRAGRSSHSSLVHSVSQRNPIDYYYYDEPTELITAKKQPVPLNEHNDRVLEISLTWAVLDYIASEFVIPWQVSRHDVTGGEEVQRRENSTSTKRDDAGKYTQLLAKSVSSLELDEDSSRLRPLGITIEDNKPEIRSYLTSLLDYAYCSNCHRHFDAEKTGKNCPEGCNRILIDAESAHEDCIDTALQNATAVFVDGYRNYTDRLKKRVNDLKGRRKELAAKRDATTIDEKIEQHRRMIEQIDTRIEVLDDYLESLSEESYGDMLTEAFAEFAFNLRSVSDDIDISIIDETGEPTEIGDDRGGRSSRLALGELHPGAAYLHERRPHVVSQVFTDDKASTDLRERVEKASDNETSSLASEFVCTECHEVSTEKETTCQCGSRNWQERQLYAMESVEAILDTQPLPNELDVAGTVYERPTERVQNTFSRRHTEILQFDPSENFALVAESGERLGTLSYGRYDILEYTESFRAKYQSGGFDEERTQFQVCAEPDCSGIIYEDQENTRRCSVNSNHAPDIEGTETAYARFGYEYETEGLRLSLLEVGVDAMHTLGHGLRLALQKLSGVPIRDVSEHVGDDHVDVFDVQEGGAAVARQLIQERDGRFENFTTAMEMLETQFDCDCMDGCPRCVYQYGCAKQNQPRTFDLNIIQERIIENGVQLQRLDNE